MPSNSSQKAFQCNVCQKYFSRKFTLDMHLLIHKGVKPHMCSFCGRCFRQKGTLMRHKALHTQETTYQCELCQKVFRQKNIYLHHLKHNHSISTNTLDRRRCNNQLESDKMLDLTSKTINHQPMLFAPNLNLPSLDLYEQISNQYQASVSKNNHFPMNQPNSMLQSYWRCDICSSLIAFDAELCRNHIALHKKEFALHSTFVDNSSEQWTCRPTLAYPGVKLNRDPNFFQEQEGLKIQDFDFNKLPMFNDNFVNLATHEPDTTLTCIPCQMDFETEDDLECHVKTHVQSVLDNCSDSDDEPEVKFQPMVQIQGESNTTENNTLEMTNTFTTGNNNINEIRATTSKTKNTYKMTTKSRHKLKSSEINNTSKISVNQDKNMGECNKQPKSNSTNIQANFELNRQLNLPSTNFKCRLCNQCFLLKSSLIQHTRLKHFEKYKCLECKKEFSYQEILKLHSCQIKEKAKHMETCMSAPVIDLSKLSNAEYGSVIGIIPLENSTSKQNLGIPIVSCAAALNQSKFTIVAKIVLKTS